MLSVVCERGEARPRAIHGILCAEEGAAFGGVGAAELGAILTAMARAFGELFPE